MKLNPASYFSLNFYDPVNKLLQKYGAQKVFLEGDAIILAILEREGEPSLAVSRMAVLAREIIEIVRGYNELMQRSGIPQLELGIGITLQDAAPLYLMDGEHQIMISEALNNQYEPPVPPPEPSPPALNAQQTDRERKIEVQIRRCAAVHRRHTR